MQSYKSYTNRHIYNGHKCRKRAENKNCIWSIGLHDSIANNCENGIIGHNNMHWNACQYPEMSCLFYYKNYIVIRSFLFDYKCMVSPSKTFQPPWSDVIMAYPQAQTFSCKIGCNITDINGGHCALLWPSVLIPLRSFKQKIKLLSWCKASIVFFIFRCLPFSVRKRSITYKVVHYSQWTATSRVS